MGAVLAAFDLETKRNGTEISIKNSRIWDSFCKLITSARIKSFSKSVCIALEALGMGVFLGAVQARVSSSPVVKKVINSKSL